MSVGENKYFKTEVNNVLVDQSSKNLHKQLMSQIING